MIIDVAISSCGRMSMLEETLSSFRRRIKSAHDFRFVICEDMVDNPVRQEEGRRWLDLHKDDFDTIVYADRKLTYVYCFSEILKYVRSDYFFRLEDDVEFVEDIDIDPIIEWMSGNKDVCQVCFTRGGHNKISPEPIEWDGDRRLIDNKFCSIGTGVFSREEMVDIIGQTKNGECHEMRVLTPIALRTKRCVIAEGIGGGRCYDHIGGIRNFHKGAWI